MTSFIQATMFQNYQREVANSKFDPKELSYLLTGGKKQFEDFQQKLDAYKKIQWDPNLFNNGRVQWIKQSIKQLPHIMNPVNARDVETAAAMAMAQQFEAPGTIHIGMFFTCIDLMGTQKQRKQFLSKCLTYEIIGCYAQTEIGHGSDVQSLQTTATFDFQNDQFVLNTPTLEAAKYWPGDLAIHANWALVHARCIINDKDYGIQNFLLKIRDQSFQVMPGIQIGDIGPKWGFFAKDNGYMILNNVRIPRKNMLRKYVHIENGVLQKRGNPRVGYATMMLTRRLISVFATKQYAQALVIAGKYSFARKQFRDDNKQEIPIIDYQLQQNKLISCFAEHFAIQIGGLKVSSLTQLNIQKINNNDDSLMKEAHNCLCLTKALYTQYCLRGMEICRLACGGHGFSQYSGLPHIVQQFTQNVTLQGQNTVMYLQVARYVMKAYGHFMSKKKPLGDSVKYIDSFQYLMGVKCEVQNKGGWNTQNIRILLAQSVLASIVSSTDRLMSDQNQKDAWNKKAGLRLLLTARSHSVYWTFNAFTETVAKFQGGSISKNVVTQLCMLYGINSILQNTQSLIQNSIISSQQLTTLKQRKELLLKSLRESFAGLIQCLGLPNYLQRSALTYGNVYQNMFQLAKKNTINEEMSPSVDIIKRGLTNTRPKL